MTALLLSVASAAASRLALATFKASVLLAVDGLEILGERR